MKTVRARDELKWKIHSSHLLEEVLKNPGAEVLRIPIGIFASLLAAVGRRAATLNDAELNALMCRLTIYTIADPESPDYDPARLREIYRISEELRKEEEA